MNRQIRRLVVGFLVLYTVLFVQLNRIHVTGADDYNTRPDNNRQAIRDFSRPRGTITTADGVVVAESVPSDDRFKHLRTYPTGELFAHVTGFLSFQYGTDGLERQYNDVLAGQTAAQKVNQGLAGLFDDEPNTGDLRLTLSAALQRAARDALGDKEGSVVALDPRTGAVLALWTNPSYDPNLLSAHDLDAVRAAREALLADPRKPLLANAYQERYMPGSTFKIVTVTAALENGIVTPETVYPDESSWTPPQTTNPIRNYGGTVCGGDLFEVFRRSCNIPFAKMAVEMGAAAMVGTAEAFKFGTAPPIDLPRPAASFYPPVGAFAQDLPKLAQTGFGQNDVSMTPLHLALLAATVANDGVMMQPYVVAEARDRSGRLLSRATPRPWARPMGPATVAFLREAMVQVVTSGTARCCLQLAGGQQAAAKTGTAQLGTDPPLSHAWITTYAPAEAPRVAVAVFVKATPEVTAGTGGTVAGPIAKKVLDAALALPDPLTTTGP